MKSLELAVNGMHCDGCTDTIKALLDRGPGVRLAAVSFAHGDARILDDPAATDEARLIAAVERGGFLASPRSP